MADSNALETLLELAAKEAGQQAVHLGAAMRSHQEQADKLTLLIRYRNDYAQRYQQHLNQGVDIRHQQNFREFLIRLDDAIDGQQRLVQQAEQQVNHQQKCWQTAECKRLSFHTLIERRHVERQHAENKQEQRNSDEFAARRYAIHRTD